jgi:hypothetical protein
LGEILTEEYLARVKFYGDMGEKESPTMLDEWIGELGALVKIPDVPRSAKEQGLSVDFIRIEVFKKVGDRYGNH